MDEYNYVQQKLRGLKRKIEIVNMMGGKCTKCGYNESMAALEFHHRNPEEKVFPMDMRHFSNMSMEQLIEESKKCDLLCSNCHKELHYPQFLKENIEKTLEGMVFESLEKKAPRKLYKHTCEYCGKEFKAVTGKRFCSNECRIKSKNYPSYEILLEKYNELQSWQKVADFFNLNRNVIRRIRKKGPLVQLVRTADS